MASNIEIISGDVYSLRDGFKAVAVDRDVNFDKEAGFALQILGASDYAMKAAMSNRQAVCDAVTNVAAIGISLNPAKKQAYLVPRKSKICLDISYIGLIDLAVATGSILWAQANVVREHDNFVINGFDKPPTHAHDPFAGAAARGPIKGAYVVVKTPDGEYLTHTMDIESIYSVRNRSESWKAGQAGPWKSDEGEMIKKTVVKQAYKYWPKTERSGRVDAAIHHLNTDGGEGLSPGSSVPSNEYIDPAPVVAGVADCLTDAQAAAYWKTNNAAFLKQPPDHAALKAAVVARRKHLAAELAERTIEMQPAGEPAAMADEGNPF